MHSNLKGRYHSTVYRQKKAENSLLKPKEAKNIYQLDLRFIG